MPFCDKDNAVLTDNGDEASLSFKLNGKLLKEDVFPCLSRGNDSYRLYLTSTELILQSIRQNQDVERFKIDDLFGCHTLKHKKQAWNKRLTGQQIPRKDQNGAYICFYLYPRSKRSLFSSRILQSSITYREKVPLVFLVQKPGRTFEENLDYATVWKDEALKILRQKYPKWYSSFSVNSKLIGTNPTDAYITDSNSANSGRMTNIPDDLSVALSSFHLFQRRFLVILNPKSGQGRTVSIFRTQVAPILQEAGIRPELFVTQHAGHAQSLVAHTNLLNSNVHGIITVGGDGLLYEVINGLRSRIDAAQISSLPVGIIAGGSGNGLARSIAHYSGESADYMKNPVLSTTLAVARGKVVPVNLTEVDLDSKKVYSFLSAGWGLLADIDVESEVLRPIGEIRFTLWSFLRLAKLRSYKAKLSYIPSSINSMASLDTPSTETKRVYIDGEFLCVYSACQSYIGSDLIFAPKATANDNLIHLMYIRDDVGRLSATHFLLALDKGSHADVNGVHYVTVKEFCIQSEGGIGGNLVIDGERVSGENLTVRISPRPLNVFSL